MKQTSKTSERHQPLQGTDIFPAGNRPRSQKIMSLKNVLRFAGVAAMFLGCAGWVHGQQAAEAKEVPVVDGGSGPCSVVFTVTNNQGKPVYAATISVHIAYGFMGSHKLDLEVETNINGKAQFKGLPEKVKGNTMLFRAKQGDQTGAAVFNPAQKCNADEAIAIVKQ